MAQQTWVQTLNAGAPWQTTSGAVLSSTTPSTLSPQSTGGNDFTLPANYWYIGLTIRVTAQGYITTTTTSTTAAISLAANKAGAYTAFGTAASLTTGNSAYTGLQWFLDALVTCTALGSSGNTLATQGKIIVPINATAPSIGTANTVIVPIPSASGEQLAAIDTTSPEGLALRCTLAGANASIQCTNFVLESIC